MPQRLHQAEPPAEAVPHLRWLRGLVTGLAVVMGLGIAAIVALLWLRLPSGGGLPTLSEGIVLPPGARVEAVTFARDWTVVVTDGGAVLVYDRAGRLAQQVTPR